MTTVLVIIAAALFAVSAGAAVVRVILGPTILDRMLATDVVLTILLLVIGAEMVVNGHSRTLPIMIVLAGTAALSTVAVARYVSQQDRAADDPSPVRGVTEEAPGDR